MTSSVQTKKPLLIIEDSDEDFGAFERIVGCLASSPSIYRCTDGDEALSFLYHRDPYTDPRRAPRPSAILLDLNLPGTDGRDVIAQIKQDAALKTIPVIIFTTSSNPKDIQACYQQGANGYIIKPIDLNRLKQTIQLFVEYWFNINQLPDLSDMEARGV